MTTVIMRAQDRSYGGGKVRVRLPHVQVTLPDHADLVADVVAHIERKLRERLAQPPSRFVGLAKWVAREVRIEGRAVTWPTSDAVERLAQHAGWAAFIEPAWIEDVVRAHVDQAFSMTPRRRLFAGR